MLEAVQGQKLSVCEMCIRDRYGTMGIWLSWPIGWTIAMALSLFFYKKGVWKTGSFTAREERMEEDVMELESESAFLYPEE